MGRPSNTAERRQQITQGLMTVMAERGYEKASIQAIAKAAGLSSGLIHYHFKSKQEILVELTNSLVAIAESRYEQQLTDDVTSSEDKLNAIIDSALALDKSADPATMSAWVCIASEAIKQKEVKDIYQTIMAKYQNLLIGLITEIDREKQLSISRQEIKNLATMILASISGAFQLAAASTDLHTDYAANTLKDLIKLKLKNS